MEEIGLAMVKQEGVAYCAQCEKPTAECKCPPPTARQLLRQQQRSKDDASYRTTFYDWTTEDGRYRHFYFDYLCEDTDTDVAELVQLCLQKLGDVAGCQVTMRCPLTIERGLKSFEDDSTYAHIRYQLAIDLKSRPDANVRFLGL